MRCTQVKHAAVKALVVQLIEANFWPTVIEGDGYARYKKSLRSPCSCEVLIEACVNWARLGGTERCLLRLTDETSTHYKTAVANSMPVVNRVLNAIIRHLASSALESSTSESD